ncbi:MAG: hypothetical protein COW85_03840 [Ignavibacteria bacterium CG22_combo_CG10-13_8_21_14_all_37_15]|nr:MAG: hypothetical protein AUJ54_15245 [Ignavibacteria bacterium CG1_02_37_35]PIP78557.1 MAG: hypothetical protein COW85_03840 [Ignavibacteria bacterium CG22_combo_CG10-13_8_21_14_all_37_15]PIS45268.1 MAG: hypothetical protein COT22_06255 [Ignavibacteria bacterium CG08_land_8_20_14_0_20_37_9]PIX94475.1 MAG: hypothetical protein COZ25_05135 [Ignavibacteria bacterium CG_4_10_14_3_um_filter_37_18]PJC59954.1 MAG: hypothetical protein CO025_04410 [Ignavibacteria bacterium CG_4_9_14_0_2_um_filter_3
MQAVTLIHRQIVIAAIKRNMITRPIQNTAHRVFIRLARTVIQPQHGQVQHLIMMENIFRFIPENIEESGICVLNAILPLQITKYLAVSIAMSITTKLKWIKTIMV